MYVYRLPLKYLLLFSLFFQFRLIFLFLFTFFLFLSFSLSLFLFIHIHLFMFHANIVGFVRTSSIIVWKLTHPHIREKKKVFRNDIHDSISNGKFFRKIPWIFDPSSNLHRIRISSRLIQCNNSSMMILSTHIMLHNFPSRLFFTSNKSGVEILEI